MIIYQMKHTDYWQMMGYVVVADNGNVTVIDGGRFADAPLMREILARHGNHVDLWFLTHPHPDHHEVFIEISREPREITVDAFYHYPLDPVFVSLENRYRPFLIEFNEALRTTPFPVRVIKKGDTFDLGNLHIEALHTPITEVSKEHFNEASCPLMFTERDLSSGGEFKVLFLGDLGPISGREFTKSEPQERLRADMVQVAHHGQNAAEEDVYKIISPRYTLWPTPEWLWTNTDNPAFPGKGPYKTLETRAWLDRIGATPITSFYDTTVITIKNGVVKVSDFHDNILT